MRHWAVVSVLGCAIISLAGCNKDKSPANPKPYDPNVDAPATPVVVATDPGLLQDQRTVSSELRGAKGAASGTPTPATTPSAKPAAKPAAGSEPSTAPSDAATPTTTPTDTPEKPGTDTAPAVPVTPVTPATSSPAEPPKE